MAPEQTSCATCGTEPRPGARFCDACGAPISRLAAPTEHKQVTVLFADVVRSMDLAVTLDAEALRDVMSELFSHCGAVVERLGGTVDKFTGDGIMALFGAPIAMEDHAVRACLAALEVQREARRLSEGVLRRYGVGYDVRVGLNSGDVITGQIGSGPTSYTAVGVHVGMAQRMESAAQPGAVMISESTARLVERIADLGEPELVTIKGRQEPVLARRLLAVGVRHEPSDRRPSTLIGRQREADALETLLDGAAAGSGCVVGIAGPAGMGKSRIASEVTSAALRRGIRTATTFCESHASEVPFYVVARLLRNALAAGNGQRPHAAEPGDVELLEELFGVRTGPTNPTLSADARRRRLAQMLAAELIHAGAPTVFVIEDAHWIDAVSEALLVEVCALVPEASAMVLVTYRPEYRGELLNTPALQLFPLAPLDRAQSLTLAEELMGSDPSLSGLTRQVVSRAAGNPFFVHEIVRDLAARDVLAGAPGAYVLRGDPTDITVPATLQVAIAARIDRLDPDAKRLLNAAALAGSEFTADLLADTLTTTESSIQSGLDKLVAAELIQPTATTPAAEYAFGHPLIRAVASETQLRSVRASVHRRLAATIETRSGPDPDHNAALIATHLESAGDLLDAFMWHLRAGAWFTNRDIGAARTSWQQARAVADRMPAGEPYRDLMRITPRSLLCGSSWRAGGSVADAGFEELDRLCRDADAPIPLAMGMAGHMSALSVHSRARESAALAPQYEALVESIGDPSVTTGLLFAAIYANHLTGDTAEALRLAQRVIDLAAGDPIRGNFLTGSPLAFATAMRAAAKCGLGRDGWLQDFDDANRLARAADPTTYVSTVMFKYSVGISVGALVVDDTARCETAEALEIALAFSEDMALGLAQVARGLVLVHSGDDADRAHGFELLAAARALADADRYSANEVRLIEIEEAAQCARSGDLDHAIETATQVALTLTEAGMPLYLGHATTVLVTALLGRAAAGDVTRARSAVDRLADFTGPSTVGFHELPLVRLRALVTRAEGDDTGYRRLANRYRRMAHERGYAGHVLIADSMG